MRFFSRLGPAGLFEPPLEALWQDVLVETTSDAYEANAVAAD